MTRIKIFLASSSELAEDRKQFEIMINRKNKAWFERGTFIDLVMWEDFLGALSRTGLQDEYNKSILECDVLVMLFSTKVGEHTEEEFDTAYEQFMATNKPFIFTYFKEIEITTTTANKHDLETLWAFQEKVRALRHFYISYKNVDALKFDFHQQLDRLTKIGFIKLVDEVQKEGSIPGDSARVYSDPQTGLMWTIRDNGKNVTWPQADDYAQQLRLGGWSDWRLPTIDELEELHDPKIAIRAPFRIHALMWSSTKSGPDHALFFNFWVGLQGTLPLTNDLNPTRAFCVRRAEQ